MTNAFRCRGTPISVEQLGPHSALIGGTVDCTLNHAATFSLVLTDGGRNPPNQDAYHMRIYNGEGGVLYDWEDDTTIGLGDLSIRTG